MAAGQNFSPAQIAQYGTALGGAYPSDPAGQYVWYEKVASALNYNASHGLPMYIPYLVGIGAQAPTQAQSNEMRQYSLDKGWYQRENGTWSNPQLDAIYSAMGRTYEAPYAPPGLG